MVKPLEDLVTALSKLPTIGKKTAWRLALHLVDRPQDEVKALADAIQAVKTSVTICKQCFNLSEDELCRVCSSPARDQSILCVVERPIDVFTLENSGRYRGIYHVLGGVLSPINGITADKLRIKELASRINANPPRELILGLGASADAETTSLYLSRILQREGMRITRLARGLPAGIELEYVDQVTLTQALNERIEVHYGNAGDR
jgi:recombination protein RecR